MSTLHPRLIVSGDTLRTSADSAEHPNCWHNRGSNRVDGRARVPRSSLSKTNERDASIRNKIYFEPELFFCYEFISYIIFTKRINHRIIFRLQIVTQLSLETIIITIRFVYVSQFDTFVRIYELEWKRSLARKWDIRRRWSELAKRIKARMRNIRLVSIPDTFTRTRQLQRFQRGKSRRMRVDCGRREERGSRN